MDPILDVTLMQYYNRIKYNYYCYDISAHLKEARKKQ